MNQSEQTIKEGHWKVSLDLTIKDENPISPETVACLIEHEDPNPNNKTAAYGGIYIQVPDVPSTNLCRYAFYLELEIIRREDETLACKFINLLFSGGVFSAEAITNCDSFLISDQLYTLKFTNTGFSVNKSIFIDSSFSSIGSLEFSNIKFEFGKEIDKQKVINELAEIPELVKRIKENEKKMKDQFKEFRRDGLAIADQPNAFFYRGQSDHRWPLISTFHRRFKHLRNRMLGINALDGGEMSLKNSSQGFLRDRLGKIGLYLKAAFPAFEFDNNIFTSMDFLEDRRKSIEKKEAKDEAPSEDKETTRNDTDNKFKYSLQAKLGEESRVCAVLQHFGFPTHYLDWSSSPYVALFFALANKYPNYDQPAKIFILNSVKLTNLTKSPNHRDAWLASLARKIDQDQTISPLSMERLSPQQSFFTKTQVVYPEALYRILDNFYFEHTPSLFETVEIKASDNLMEELYSMNITHQSLFPGLEGFCKTQAYLMEREFESIDKALEASLPPTPN